MSRKLTLSSYLYIGSMVILDYFFGAGKFDFSVQHGSLAVQALSLGTLGFFDYRYWDCPFSWGSCNRSPLTADGFIF